MSVNFQDFLDTLDSCTESIIKLEREKCLQALSTLNSANLNEKWLAEDGNAKILSEKLLTPIERATIPEFTKSEHSSFEASDFQGYPEKTELTFVLLKIVLEKLEHTCPFSTCRDFLHKILPSLLILLSSNVQPSLWSSTNIVEQALSILNILTKIFISENDNLHKILFQDDKSPTSSVFHKYLLTIKPRLYKHSWTKNPNIQKSFQWMLSQVKFPYLSNFIDYVLPPALNFVDDFEVFNKCAGVKCLHHIIDNVSKEELRWHGRAEVIFDVLEKTLYNHDPQLIELVHITILSLLPVFGKLPDDIEKHHKIFQMILRDVEFENKITVRRSLTKKLPQFVDILGISVVKHSKKLLSVFESYLEVYDGPEEIARLNILKTLQHFLMVAWPRVPQYTMCLSKILFKFIYDVSTDKTTTPVCVKAEIISEAEKCLVLIKICDSENLEKFLESMRSLKMTDFIKCVVSHIENHKSVDCLPDNLEEIKKFFK